MKVVPIRDSFEEHLQRELTIAAEVSGDHLLGALDILVGEDTAHLAMEKMQGTLDGEVVRRTDFDDLLVREAFRQLLLGLAKLERRRIAHRNIKPANVLVSWRGNRCGPRNIQVGI